MTTASSTHLISAQALHDESSWRIFDCRFDLRDEASGARAYAAGHIPGAVYLHLDHDLSGPKLGTNGRHPLPIAEALGMRLGSVGITPDTDIAVYDDVGGMFAARAWWLLRWLGHRGAVVVLDGGYQAWQAADLPVTIDVPSFPVQPYRVTGLAHVPSANEVLGKIGTPGFYLLDARSPDRFRGENETLDPVGGHIPGAHNRFFRDNLTAAGYFKPADVLRAEFNALLGEQPVDQVVHSCGSGVTACHNLLAMEIAGLTGTKLYAGSWSEWCSNPDRPVEKD